MKNSIFQKMTIVLLVLTTGNAMGQYQAKVNPQVGTSYQLERVHDLKLDQANNLLANVIVSTEQNTHSGMLQFQRNSITTNINYHRTYSTSLAGYSEVDIKKFAEYQGDFYISGTFTETVTNIKKLIFFKVNKSTGNVIYSEIVNVPYIDEFIDMTSDNAGAFYLLGNKFAGPTGGDIQYFVVKMKFDGTISFYREFGDTSLSEYASNIYYYSNSEIYISGQLVSATVNFKVFAAMINSAGNLINSRRISFSVSGNSFPVAYVNIQKPNATNLFIVAQQRVGPDGIGPHFILWGPSLTGALNINAYGSTFQAAINSVSYNNSYILMSAELPFFDQSNYGYVSMLYNINGTFNNARQFNTTKGFGYSLGGRMARSLLTGSTTKNGILYAPEGDHNLSVTGKLYEISTDGTNSSSCLETSFTNPALPGSYTNVYQPAINTLIQKDISPANIITGTNTPTFSVICTCLPIACRLGDEVTNNNEFFIYRNPEGVTIRLNSDVPVQTEIYNSLGQRINAGHIEAASDNGEYVIKLNEVKAGLYFIAVRTESGNVLNGKFFMD